MEKINKLSLLLMLCLSFGSFAGATQEKKKKGTTTVKEKFSLALDKVRIKLNGTKSRDAISTIPSRVCAQQPFELADALTMPRRLRRPSLSDQEIVWRDALSSGDENRIVELMEEDYRFMTTENMQNMADQLHLNHSMKPNMHVIQLLKSWGASKEISANQLHNRLASNYNAANHRVEGFVAVPLLDISKDVATKKA